MKMTVEGEHKGYPTIKIGICDERGGDPKSIDFYYRICLDNLSCLPVRITFDKFVISDTNLTSKSLYIGVIYFFRSYMAPKGFCA
ncbi:MAG: hypothetical protein FK730_01935 [Asgard group archaeon]|nr:hypothetical protein [Asgard group archaeon]